MSLPPGVALLKRGEVRYYTQRVTAPPLADCMFAALCTPLSYMGYDIPPKFVGELRKASGVPVFDAKGKPQGTNTPASVKAMKKLMPDAPIKFGGMSDERMLQRLANGEIVVRVMAVNQKLPPRLRRFVGKKWKGLHAVAIGGARRDQEGRWQVRWMDPAARPGKGYDGEFVAYADVKPALKRTPEGNVIVAFGERDAALPGKGNGAGGQTSAGGAAPATTSTKPVTVAGTGSGATRPKEGTVKLLTHGRLDEFAPIPKGTPFLHPETGEQVTRASEKSDFRLAGRSADGRFAGVWVNTRRIPGTSGLTLLLVEVERIGRPFIKR